MPSIILWIQREAKTVGQNWGGIRKRNEAEMKVARKKVRTNFVKHRPEKRRLKLIFVVLHQLRRRVLCRIKYKKTVSRVGAETGKRRLWTQDPHHINERAHTRREGVMYYLKGIE